MIRSKYSEWINVSKAINRHAVELHHKISANRGDVRQLIAAALFARTLTNTQAEILLIERGMGVQAQVMLRAGMETLFSLGAIARIDLFVHRFVNADSVQRLRLLKASKKWQSPELKAMLSTVDLTQTQAEIEAEIKKTGAEKITVEHAAEQAGLTDWYNGPYAIFSYSVHGNVRDLKRHFVINEHEDVLALQNEPDIEKLGGLFLTAGETILKATEAVSLIFDLATSEFCQEQYGALRSLVSQQKLDT